MPTIDKNQAIIDFLQTYTGISKNPLFFNFGTVEENAVQVTIRSDDISLQQPFVDGSVLKRYTFVIDNFKSVAYNPVVKNLSDENVSDHSEVQALLDWINSQGRANNFPNFGNDCIIEKMETLTTQPDLVGVDTTLTPPMAVYRISIQIDYIDKSQSIWK